MGVSSSRLPAFALFEPPPSRAEIPIRHGSLLNILTQIVAYEFADIFTEGRISEVAEVIEHPFKKLVRDGNANDLSRHCDFILRKNYGWWQNGLSFQFFFTNASYKCRTTNDVFLRFPTNVLRFPTRVRRCNTTKSVNCCVFRICGKTVSKSIKKIISIAISADLGRSATDGTVYHRRDTIARGIGTGVGYCLDVDQFQASSKTVARPTRNVARNTKMPATTRVGKIEQLSRLHILICALYS
jgi:hypothetical protein